MSMRCSPRYRNEERQESGAVCSPNCFHYEACKKELGLPKNWKFPIWYEAELTEEDLATNRYHLTKIGQKKRWRVRYINKK